MNDTKRTQPWTAEELANFNSAWFSGRSLSHCDNVSGNRCVWLRGRHERMYDPLRRIVWGWAGGSADSGVLWDVNCRAHRPDRTGFPLSEAELDFIALVERKRVEGNNPKIAMLTPDYMAAVLNRTDVGKQLARAFDTKPPELGLL